HRVPERRQHPLPPARADPAHLRIGKVKERLQLLPGKRPPPRGTLEIRDMSGGVPLMTDLHRIRAEPLLALGRPAVTRVSSKIAEQPQRLLISPDRRR